METITVKTIAGDDPEMLICIVNCKTREESLNHGCP